LLLLSGWEPGPGEAARVTSSLGAKQQADGGWVDCEDTAWCSFVLRRLAPDRSDLWERALCWLAMERAGAGWGYCQRDAPCIPLTATVNLLAPSLRDQRSDAWLRETWAGDLSAPVRLSYKASWYLLARGESPLDDELAARTTDYLLSDQRDDGGWGPWREHPAPTDCFSTGLAMWSLATASAGQDTDQALVRAVDWCARNRLETGFFPTHYIEEGTAWLLLGWSAVMRANAA